MQKRIMFVGMDVHQKSIDITTAEQGHDGKVAHFGCIGGDLQSLDTAVDKLVESGAELRLVYEAGPCGYVIYRHLTERGLHCTLVSPASVPKRPSDRVKTDRRDARTLALQHRAGALRAIYVPEPEDEAIRDLVRGREDAVHNRRRPRQRLNSSLRCSLLVRGQPHDGRKTGGSQPADISRTNRRVQSGAACQAGAVGARENPQSKRADCCVYRT